MLLLNHILFLKQALSRKFLETDFSLEVNMERFVLARKHLTILMALNQMTLQYLNNTFFETNKLLLEIFNVDF